MEAEVMLAGNWKNIEDLEENLTLEELEAILKAMRDKEHRANKFFAALKGIDIDEGEVTAADKVEEMKKRVEAKRQGVSVESMDLEDFGLDIFTEE